MELIKQVTEAEKNAQQRKADAIVQAKKIVSDAERIGRERLNAARTEAEAETKRLLEQAEEQAAGRETEILRQTRIDCDALRQSVKGQLSAAVQLIVGKVVNA